MWLARAPSQWEGLNGEGAIRSKDYNYLYSHTATMKVMSCRYLLSLLKDCILVSSWVVWDLNVCRRNPEKRDVHVRDSDGRNLWEYSLWGQIVRSQSGKIIILTTLMKWSFVDVGWTLRICPIELGIFILGFNRICLSRGNVVSPSDFSDDFEHPTTTEACFFVIDLLVFVLRWSCIIVSRRILNFSFFLNIYSWILLTQPLACKSSSSLKTRRNCKLTSGFGVVIFSHRFVSI